MKRVVKGTVVAHLWANQSQDEARSNGNGNIYFHGDTIYSYGSHFPIARHVKRGKKTCILFTNKNYSVTTSGHKSMVQGAIARGVPVFHVDDVLTTSYAKALSAYDKAIKGLATKALRSRVNAEWYVTRIEELVQQANDYAKFFGLKRRLKVPSPKELQAAIQAGREAAKRQRVLEAKRQVARDMELAAKAVKWQAGTLDQMPSDCSRVLLRVRGGHLQTSKGATVELPQALRLLPLIRAGRSWQRNGQTIQVGDFQLDSIDEAGNIKIGCHYIDRQEIDRIAGVLGV